jgi:hypothetical protein
MTCRSARRSYIREMDRVRRSGDWPAWQFRPVAPGDIAGAGGWTTEIHAAAHNGVYAVLIRTAETAWGPVQHLAIRNVKGSRDVPWADKQRIKNELSGRERTAVEVFPAASRLMDGAHMYHLFVLPEGFALPFNLKE